jgi:hypothetical protein
LQARDVFQSQTCGFSPDVEWRTTETPDQPEWPEQFGRPVGGQADVPGGEACAFSELEDPAATQPYQVFG